MSFSPVIPFFHNSLGKHEFELADMSLNRSGLEQSKKREVFKDAGGVWGPDKIKNAILVTHEQAQDLDEARVQRG